MPKIAYKQCTLRKAGLAVVQQANEIIDDYMAQGYKLTLRQIYYQFVSRDLIPNNLQSYKKLGTILNDGRMAGLIDWEAIEDRTRSVESLSTWSSPASIVRACAEQFRIDYWATQPYYIEVWVEKEALAGVIEKACNQRRLPYLSCRGYVSQSEMWRAAERMREQAEKGKELVVLHLGDHDPSGIDMSRDIQDRLGIFLDGIHLEHFYRLALNKQQIALYNPPPNFAKQTDSRFREYEAEFGTDSWELDALEPKVISDLILNKTDEFIDVDAWKAAEAQEWEAQKLLKKTATSLSKKV